MSVSSSYDEIISFYRWLAVEGPRAKDQWIRTPSGVVYNDSFTEEANSKDRPSVADESDIKAINRAMKTSK